VRSIKKNRQFLAKSAGILYRFSESRLTFSMADQGFGARTGKWLGNGAATG
jgi:hypothetical protein